MTKNILNLATDLVKTTNNQITNIYNEYKTDKSKHQKLLDKIKELKSQFNENKISARIDLLICKLKNETKTNYKIIEVVKDNELVALITDNMIKPNSEYRKSIGTKVDCKHTLNYDLDFGENIDYIEIKDINELNNIQNEPALIKLYKHTYRSYLGFTCYILIITKKCNYLIDTLKVRNITHDFFGCETVKFFHCENCITFFEREFCDLSCVSIYNAETENKIYCDWRIRPLHNIMKTFIQKDIKFMKKDFEKHKLYCLNKLQDILIKEKYTNDFVIFNEDIEIYAENLINHFNVAKENKIMIMECLKLRDFIAKSNDESINYVMTDAQLIKLIFTKPQDRDEFIECFGRMSALVREHIHDFIAIIKSHGSEDKVEDGTSSSLLINCDIPSPMRDEINIKGMKRK